jgi:hypothetical protein
VLAFRKSPNYITNKVLLSYVDNGNLAFVEGYGFCFVSKEWQEEYVIFPPKPEIETDVRSIDFPGPVEEEVKIWLDTLK